MNPYVILTDSACDIKQEDLEKWGVKFRELMFFFENDEAQYSNSGMSTKEFYQKMRDGGIAKTSAVNVSAFEELFEEELKLGNDILYIGFSSGLSTTYNSARLAGENLKDKYPNNTIITIDSLAASAGFGLLVYLAVKEKEAGKTIEEVAKYVEDTRLKVCHWFTVDDLVYLKRGGRISPTVAFVGNLLGVKPVLHVDDEGHLINMFKRRGRYPSIKALAEKYGELGVKGSPIFISHGDCIEDVETLKQILKDDYKADVELVTDVGPVIGAHSGPGTLALFFLTEGER